MRISTEFYKPFIFFHAFFADVPALRLKKSADTIAIKTERGDSMFP